MIWPLWSYGFSAPQYPEGLVMWIYASHLGGRVDLINELNHYIGMRTIAEEGFVELKVIPVLLVVLIVGGVLVALFGGVKSLIAWVFFFALSGVGLLADFYHWLYVYGHDLDPHAAIKIPPFTPHLIGSYSFLNFHIMAWPDVGALAMICSFLFGAAALLWELAHVSARASLGASLDAGTPSADNSSRYNVGR
jgi:copper chaperone NosL